MLGPDTYRPQAGSAFHDWRFGHNGVPHPATCGTCGRKTDSGFVNQAFRVKRRTRDLTATFHGYRLVSTRFREFCRRNPWAGLDSRPSRPIRISSSLVRNAVCSTTANDAKLVLKSLSPNVALSTASLMPRLRSCWASVSRFQTEFIGLIWNLDQGRSSTGSLFSA